MAALLSGFPAQPHTSIIKEPSKFGRLPCFTADLEKLGYSTSFLFGGQLSYGNIRSYLYYSGFDQIVEGKDFDDDLPRGKLGVHDEQLFQRQIQQLKAAKTPFFAALFTMSTHSPYDIPMEAVIDWGGKERAFLNSVLYADRCLGAFMEAAKKEDWYSNTLFVFTADHSHSSPKNWQTNQPELRRIPLLFYGAALKQDLCGRVDTLPAAQTDLAATLLGQFGKATPHFPYSKNLLNPHGQRHAFFSFDEGFCIVKPASQICWHVDTGGWTEYERTANEANAAQMVREGQAILQRLMNDYFSR
jgi:phosphoglycerol transferase MdoB-like AlkP superfamily enzyme